MRPTARRGTIQDRLKERKWYRNSLGKWKHRRFGVRTFRLNEALRLERMT